MNNRGLKKSGFKKELTKIMLTKIYEPLVEEVKKLIDNTQLANETRDKFVERLKNKILTRDEGALDHFCVFFIAIDPIAKMVFIGHHKKSNRWIPNGGHIDKGELAREAVIREIGEEWGIKSNQAMIGNPKLLNITEIENPKQWNVCKTHYNIWYFIEVDKNNFNVDEKLVLEEFYETKWINITGAKKLIADTPSVIEAINIIENNFLNDEK